MQTHYRAHFKLLPINLICLNFELFQPCSFVDVSGFMCGDKFILELFSDHLEKHLECGVVIKTDADKNNVNVGYIFHLYSSFDNRYTCQPEISFS